jgi:hypothetical protein
LVLLCSFVLYAANDLLAPVRKAKVEIKLANVINIGSSSSDSGDEDEGDAALKNLLDQIVHPPANHGQPRCSERLQTSMKRVCQSQLRTKTCTCLFMIGYTGKAPAYWVLGIMDGK